MGGRKHKKPAAFQDAMKIKSSKKKQGKVRGSRGGQLMKDRKDTLLVEYKKLRKANSFIDNRIGEKDMELDPEEKTLMRFRAQRMKGMREDRFNLAEDGGFGTEMGFGGDGSEDEGDGGMGKDVLEELKEGLPSRQGQRKKSKREVMREVIAKSKMYRHEKAKEVEENFEKQIDLDQQFQKLLESSTFLNVLSNPNEVTSQQVLSHPDSTTPDDQFDDLIKQLATEGKVVKATDRTETHEEIDERKEKNLERERARKEKRMMAFSDDEDLDSEGESQGLGGGRKQKRLKHEEEYVPGGDDDCDDMPYGTEDVNQISALEQRRQVRASGDDPLQVSFRKLTEKLMKRYSKGEGEEASESDSSEEGASDNESNEDVEDVEDRRPQWNQKDMHAAGLLKHPVYAQESFAEDTKEGSSATTDILVEDLSDRSNSPSGDVVFSKQGELSHGKEGTSRKATILEDLQITDVDALPVGGKSADSDSDTSQSDDGESGDKHCIIPARGSSPAKVIEESNAKSEHCTVGNVASSLLDTYPVPEDYREFSGWACGRSSADVGRIISKIRVGNHSELNAAVKMKLEALFSIVLEHFGRLASDTDTQLCDLDGLIDPLCDMAREVPLHAGRAARQELTQMQEHLLEDIQGSNGSSGWPTRRSILVMRLISIIFPVSDRFHAASTPLALLVSQYLAQCSIIEHYHIGIGLFMTTFALQLALPAKRFSAEPLAFVMMTIKQCIPGSAQDLLVISHHKKQRFQEDKLTVDKMLRMAPDSKYYKSNAFKVAATRLALRCLAQQVELNKKSISFPEVFAPTVPTLQQLSTTGSLPKDLQDMLNDVMDVVKKTIRSTSRSRKPLIQKFRLATPEVKQFNPRMDVTNVSRSSDPDMKEMKKKLNREKRGAMKELRKDAVFMSRVRQSEKNKVDKERLESEKRFYKELNAFEQDMKSGGQKGMNPHLKKKKR